MRQTIETSFYYKIICYSKIDGRRKPTEVKTRLAADMYEDESIIL